MLNKLTKFIAAALLLLLLIQTIGPIQSASAAKRYAILQESTNRSFVPIRYTAENFGYKVQWKGEEQKVLLSNGSKSVEFTVDTKQVKVNGKLQQLDASPFNLAGTVYIPLRFAGETLGTEVEWQKSGRVVLTSGSKKTEIETIALNRIERAVKTPVSASSTTVEISKKKVSVNVVYVDLYHPAVHMDTVYANNKIGSTEPFKNMIERSKASVAVNGTFFNAYSTTDVKIPYGYIVQSGKVINKASGDERTIFIYTKDGDAQIVDGETELKKLLDQGIVEAAVQAGPRLVRNGKVDTNPTAEGFKDPKVLTNRAGRTAIGVTKEGKVIIITTSAVTIKELAEVMVKLGATAAMNLDGGASSGLYAKGTMITPPGRDLSNALIATF